MTPSSGPSGRYRLRHTLHTPLRSRSGPSIMFISLMNAAAWGGSEELWFRTALYARQKGHPVGCALFDWPDKRPRLKQLSAAGCTVFPLPNWGRPKRTFLDKVLYKWYTPIHLTWILKTLPVEAYDLVVINQGGCLDVCSTVWRAFHTRLKRFVILYHSYRENQLLTPAIARLLSPWLAAAAHHAFAAAKIRDVLESQIHIPFPHSFVFTNPITFAPPTTYTPYPPPSDRHIFVTLGALSVGTKAQDNLIRALSSDKWRARPFFLDIYGTGPDSTLLRHLIADLGLTQKIFLKGHTPFVEAALARAHLFLQLTKQDAMPLAILEAMALSRPLVVTRLGDMPLWVHHSDNGWIAENASVAEIDHALELAWTRRSEWHVMGKRSFDIFKKRYPANPEAQFLHHILA